MKAQTKNAILGMPAALLALGLMILARPAAALNCGGLSNCYEAEAGGVSAPIQTAYGGSAIYTNNNRAGAKTVSFTVPTWGIYKITANVSARDSASNSWYFQINTVNDQNGRLRGSFSFNPPGTGNWSVTDVTNDPSDNGHWAGQAGVYVRTWTLSPGNTYVANWIGRETNAYLDWFRVVLVQPLGSPTRTPSYAPSPTFTTTPTDGLMGNYYDATDLASNWRFSRLDAPINFDWSGGCPGNSLITDGTFSVRWTGCVLAPGSGTLKFYTNSEDGVRLYINGVKLIDHWQALTSTTEYSNTMTAVSGTWYNVVLEYFISAGASKIQLSYEMASPVVLKQIIPRGSLSNSLCSTPAGSPTRSPTITVTPIPVYEGLSQTARLYNLEYIPFPVLTPGANAFYDVSQPFTTTAGADGPENTARFRIVLWLPVTGTALANSEVSCETRIGSVGTNCDTGFYYMPVTVPSESWMCLPALKRPSNLCASYFWYITATSMDCPVPITERIDAMGDPRYTPYRDEVSTSTDADLKNNYNWFFKKINDTSLANNPDYQVEYTNFLAKAKFTGYSGDNVHVDVPKLFRLVREAVVESRSIYTAMNGWNSYYVSVGDEMGGDSANNLNFSSTDGINMRAEPWGTNGTAVRNEITNNKTLVRNTTSTWRCMPWLGELWPDAAYISQWSEVSATAGIFGNLNNIGNAGIYRRDTWANCGDGGPASWKLLDGNSRTGGNGCGTMINGSNSGSSDFNHHGATYDATLLYDGGQMGTQFLMPLPDLYSCQRPWDLQDGNSQAEAAESPYQDAGVRVHTDVYSGSNQSAATIGFYDGDGSSNPNTRRGSAAVRLTDDTNKRAGWYVISGFAPSGLAGVNFVARFALLSCMRTFMDAGAKDLFVGQNSYNNTVYRIEPVPFVQITSPSPDATFNGKQYVDFAWNLTWQRWDGAKYTENYPLSVSITATVVYNLKYSMDGGINWKNCFDDSTAQAGVYADADTTTSTTFRWSLANPPLPVGSKLFRVEAYRQDVIQHYAYHQFRLYSNP